MTILLIFGIFATTVTVSELAFERPVDQPVENRMDVLSPER